MTDQIRALVAAAARNGDRIAWTPTGSAKPTTLWAGLGNRAGLGSFALTLAEEKWQKGSGRLVKKLDALGSGQLTVLVFRNVTRDRGRWTTVRTFAI